MKKFFKVSTIILFFLFSTCTLLSPVRDIIGIWETTYPVKVYYETDYNNFTGTLEPVAYEYWDIEMKISQTFSSNEVDIEWKYTRSGFTPLVDETGVVPEPSPIHLTGTINGTRIYLSKYDDPAFGELNYLTDLMEGFIDYLYTGVYSQRIYCNPNDLKFIKQ
ncbi:MAG: hypothetical protein ABIN00_02710 [candidate division WOR-3 bacterium]